MPYCTKSGSYEEFGEPRSRSNRCDLQETVHSLVHDHKSLHQVAQEHQTTCVRFYRGLSELRNLLVPFYSTFTYYIVRLVRENPALHLKLLLPHPSIIKIGHNGGIVIKRRKQSFWMTFTDGSPGTSYVKSATFIPIKSKKKDPMKSLPQKQLLLPQMLTQKTGTNPPATT